MNPWKSLALALLLTGCTAAGELLPNTRAVQLPDGTWRVDFADGSSANFDVLDVRGDNRFTGRLVEHLLDGSVWRGRMVSGYSQGLWIGDISPTSRRCRAIVHANAVDDHRVGLTVRYRHVPLPHLAHWYNADGLLTHTYPIPRSALAGTVPDFECRPHLETSQ